MLDVKSKMQLKPCPFCGGDAFMYYNEVAKQYYAGCVQNMNGTCFVISSTIGYEEAEVAADTWNRRGRIILPH